MGNNVCDLPSISVYICCILGCIWLLCAPIEGARLCQCSLLLSWACPSLVWMDKEDAVKDVLDGSRETQVHPTRLCLILHSLLQLSLPFICGPLQSVTCSTESRTPPSHSPPYQSWSTSGSLDPFYIGHFGRIPQVTL